MPSRLQCRSHRIAVAAALLALLAVAGCGDVRFRPVFGSPGGYVPPVNTGFSFSGAGTRG